VSEKPQPVMSRCKSAVLAIALVFPAAGGPVRADEITAVYGAYWAGLPAAEIRLKLRGSKVAYDDEIEIRTEGLPRLVSHFDGTAHATGRFAADRAAEPARYDALFDLRKRRNNRISMRFLARGDAIVAERGSDDTSRKPPLAEIFRRGAVDPLTAVERLRQAIAAGAGTANRSFSIPVYDGARRFDVLARVLPKNDQADGLVQVALNLHPIAGFKGESSDVGDPDDAPRPVALTLTDDSRLLPTSIMVRVFSLPLVVRLDHFCTASTPCPEPASRIVPPLPITPAAAAQRQ
jgi:Protein of unknown function (DUF3108)